MKSKLVRVFCLLFCATNSFAQQPAVEKNYESLDSRSKRILAERAKYIYKLPEGDVIDISTGIDQWKLFEKSVVVQTDSVNRNNGGFVQKEVVSKKKTLKNSDEVQAHQTLPIAVVFKNSTENSFDKNYLSSLFASTSAQTTPNVLFIVDCGQEYWRDASVQLTPSADSEIFIAKISTYITPQEISNYPAITVVACYIDSTLLVKGQLKPNKDYIVRVKYTDDPKNRIETRAVNGQNCAMHEIVDASTLRVSPEELHDLVQTDAVKLYEWDYKKNKTSYGRNTVETFIWTNKLVELKYSQPKK